jgi:hypothetical protein
MSRMATNEAKSDYFRLARRPPRIAGKLQRSFRIYTNGFRTLLGFHFSE